MPSLPDVIAAPPPRPARSAEATAAPSSGAPGEREASGTPFADLLDDAAERGGAEADVDQADSSAQTGGAQTGGAPAGADAALAALLPLLSPPPPATAPGIAAAGDLPEFVPSTGGLPVVPPVTAPPAETAATPQPPAPAQPAPPPPAASLSVAPTTAATPDAKPDGTPPQAATDSAAPATPSVALPASGAKLDSAPLFQAKDPATPTKGDATQAPSPQLQQAAQAGGNAASNGGTGQNSGQGQGQGRGNLTGPEALSALSSPADPVGTAPFPSTLAPPAAHAAAHYAAHPGENAAARLPAAQVAGQLVRVVEAGGGEFHIDLKPEELGPVRVVAELSGARVALHVQAESPETLALLRRDIHHLERALSDAGFELDGGTLNFSLRGDGEPRGFAFSGQGDGAGGRQDGPGRAIRLADSSGALPPERAARPIDGLVDISV
ncbi:flagellar hook-length control protein FliK (plasmid) [Azospirillum baldaniorum]|uniref:Flagellar hook-length control protein n=1 Tax=Azospirillum baldaniorum TaxID=1064539 RepID=A0A9P1K188_9PROT|nr:flagellar hook-length control protein FliK [Azospirillum baldaniorum]AWJ94574.1 flagellar hook-length control protein FliK [Azospirillum baldaniorum]TWA70349.1 flagellar hook-length control protein FliK [Azospirillum brasilense]CCD03645.1 putative Flagellar hook-length control protein [Azospirillum baldaniorum]